MQIHDIRFHHKYLDVVGVSHSAEGHIHLPMREEVGPKVKACSLKGLTLALHIDLF